MANYWVVRAGRADQPDIQRAAVAAKVIGIGWAEIGDIRNYDLYSNQSKEQLKQALVELHQENDPGGTVGQFRRFVHEIEIGDIVLVPVPSTKRFHIASVKGDYDYSENIYEHGYDTERELTHRRKVEWLHNDLPYSLTKGALQNTRLTVNRIRERADAVRNMLEELDSQQHSSGSSGGSANPNGTPHTSISPTRSSRSVTQETIAHNESSSELDPDERQFYAMRRGVLRQRNARHQQLVQDFARALPPCEALMEDPFDLAALITSSGVLLAEMKTLDGTPEDERRQVRAAVGQLLYYEGLCLPNEFEGLSVIKVAVFDKQPSLEHTGWMESLEITVVWQDENQRFAGLPPFPTEEDA